MTCTPSSNTLNPPPLGPPVNIGFGPVFAPPQIPFPDITIPEGVPEDILEILQNIYARIPGGKLIPNVDGSFDSVYDAVGKLMNALAPFMAIYNFFQAALNMIMCIIEVLCSLLNPFKVIRSVRKLFKQCIPDFLSMFPQIALIAMILAFILLLIALIEYLINTVIAIINDIINNINNLAEAFQIGSEEGILAITAKLSELMCLIEQLFALLIAFQAIFVIIKALAELASGKPCKRGSGSECCDDEVCPPFIGDNPEGTVGVSGRLVYHRQVNYDVSALGFPALGQQISPLRTERWQFVDDGQPQYPFNLIVTPINDNIFWPQPLTFAKGDSLKNTVPYYADLRMRLDPFGFGHPSKSVINPSLSGERYFRVKGAIVTVQPYNGVLDHNNSLISVPTFGNTSGTLKLTGGLVYEDDGITAFIVNNTQASLDTFIHLNATTAAELPAFEDGYQIQNIEWNLHINHPVLLKHQIITVGCIPELQTEAAIMDQTIPDLIPIIDQIGNLPDLDAALECLNSSISTFRQDMSLENAAVFQNSIVGCLNNLKEQSVDVFKEAFKKGVSTNKSEMSIDPSIQFIENPIKVSVILKDAGGNELANGIPVDARDELALLLKGEVTLGSISDFTYDGYSLFTADITSEKAGSGIVRTTFQGNYLSEVINRDNIDVPTEISIISLPYEFIGTDAGGFSSTSIDRRDESDVANSR